MNAGYSREDGAQVGCRLGVQTSHLEAIHGGPLEREADKQTGRERARARARAREREREREREGERERERERKRERERERERERDRERERGRLRSEAIHCSLTVRGRESVILKFRH